MIVGLDAKIVIKRSTTATEIPTVAPSNDHTDGAWSLTDVYSGEFYLNEADEKLFIRVGNTIKELQFTGAGADGNGIFTAANSGSSIPSSFVADLTDMFDIGDANNYVRFGMTEDLVVFTDTSTYKGYQAINDTNGLDVRIDFAANRFGKSVIRNTHFLAFEMQWNGLPSSAGVERMRLSDGGNLSIGTTAATSKLLVRGNGTTNATNTLLIENNAGNDLFIVKDDGQSACGIGGTAALTSASFGSWNRAQNYQTGFAYYSLAGTTKTMLIQHTGGGANPYGLDVGFQGSPTGTATAVRGTAIQTTALTNIGVYGQAEDGTANSYGVYGSVSNDTNAGSGIKAGVYGLNTPRIDYDGAGGYFLTTEANASTIYSGIEMTGVEGRSNGSTNPASSVVSVGGKFSAINGSKNYGVWIENGLIRYDTTVNATAGSVQGQIEIEINGAQYYIEVKQ